MSQDYQGKTAEGRVGRIETAKANRVGRVAGSLAVLGAASAIVFGLNKGAEALGIDVQDPATGKMTEQQIDDLQKLNQQDHSIYDSKAIESAAHAGAEQDPSTPPTDVIIKSDK